jgi:hypothetical protein
VCDHILRHAIFPLFVGVSEKRIDQHVAFESGFALKIRVFLMRTLTPFDSRRTPKQRLVWGNIMTNCNRKAVIVNTGTYVLACWYASNSHAPRMKGHQTEYTPRPSAANGGAVVVLVIPLPKAARPTIIFRFRITLRACFGRMLNAAKRLSASLVETTSHRTSVESHYTLLEEGKFLGRLYGQCYP